MQIESHNVFHSNSLYTCTKLHPGRRVRVPIYSPATTLSTLLLLGRKRNSTQCGVIDIQRSKQRLHAGVDAFELTVLSNNWFHAQMPSLGRKKGRRENLQKKNTLGCTWSWRGTRPEQVPSNVVATTDR